MHYEGTVRIPAAREQVYAFITDPARVARVIPDITEFNQTDPEHFTVKARVGMGPIRGTMELSFAMVDKVEGRAATLAGKGRGMQSTVDMTLSMELEDAGTDCDARWVADATIGGTLAGIGGRLVGGITERYVKQITERLSKADFH